MRTAPSLAHLLWMTRPPASARSLTQNGMGRCSLWLTVLALALRPAAAVLAHLASGVAIGAAWTVHRDRSASALGRSREEALAAVAGLELSLLVPGGAPITALVVGGTAVA
jgi:hypothetical protein